MIAFSCVHCGQKMRVTEEAGSKKARCPTCGRVVAVPAESSRSAAPSAPTVLTVGPGKAGGTVVPPAIQLMPTRTDSAAAPPELTDFLQPAQQADELGRLGPYRVLRVLGSGGMGVVFLAEDPLLGRQVALKAMLPALAASATARQRFLREARALAVVEHDHVVALFHVGEDRGIPFFAMQLLEGESLEWRIRRAQTGAPGAALETTEVLRIGREMASGLAAIQARGLIHRDIKPANVWLERDTGRVKILDFGLVRPAGAEAPLTQVGAVVGSPAFMAPEQASNRAVDGRCDLFSLGVVLYLLCTGVQPFEAGDALATLVAVTSAEPPPPTRHNPRLPPGLSELVMRLLAKKPGDRPGSAQAVIDAIGEIEEQVSGR
jgi:serine/threonine protein kinase